MNKNGRRQVGRPSTRAITTTLMDLLQALADMTKDDTVVMAVMKEVFASCNVKVVRSLAPVRLGAAESISVGSFRVPRRL
jgi:hypothetical protein